MHTHGLLVICDAPAQFWTRRPTSLTDGSHCFTQFLQANPEVYVIKPSQDRFLSHLFQFTNCPIPELRTV
jgi:hypothetical protein